MDRFNSSRINLISSVMTSCLREAFDMTIAPNMTISSGLTFITACLTDRASFSFWYGVISYMITSATDLNFPFALTAAVIDPITPPQNNMEFF